MMNAIKLKIVKSQRGNFAVSFSHFHQPRRGGSISIEETEFVTYLRRYTVMMDRGKSD